MPISTWEHLFRSAAQFHSRVWPPGESGRGGEGPVLGLGWSESLFPGRKDARRGGQTFYPFALSRDPISRHLPLCAGVGSTVEAAKGRETYTDVTFTGVLVRLRYDSSLIVRLAFLAGQMKSCKAKTYLVDRKRARSRNSCSTIGANFLHSASCVFVSVIQGVANHIARLWHFRRLQVRKSKSQLLPKQPILF